MVLRGIGGEEGVEERKEREEEREWVLECVLEWLRECSRRRVELRGDTSLVKRRIPGGEEDKGEFCADSLVEGAEEEGEE